MNSAVGLSPETLTREPILGYLLRERIGVGGCGEVWKAEAPGGMLKAVKVVHGGLDESRASNELQSLNRMKNVRHPFLLSIERVEQVDGKLIVVTELADSNLKQELERCQQAGQAGIPREELLGYLRDTADALDFLYEKFFFQHLDVKPENLLLLAQRIKVSDFGLVMDVRAASGTVPGGLTPLYAAPEIFDGRPSRNSDQYSLAIVFQELLTGTPPFNGRTAAQLAAQHLQTQPVLNHLPPNDRHIIARALSKKPDQRFASCRELIAALTAAGNAASSSSQFVSVTSQFAATAPASKPVAPAPLTPPDPVMQSVSQTLSLGEDYLRQISSNRAWRAPIVELPPLESSAEPVHFRPTLIVGLGGAAGRVMAQYRRRLLDRYQDADQIAAWQMLLLDTDSHALRDVVQQEGEIGLRDQDVIAAPLRKPEEYRAGSAELLRWMSRRWLYNIPRSLQTEGIRPLGRLALVDHAARIRQRLLETLEKLVDPERLVTSELITGRHFFPVTPRVIVLGSISGGTGSGMLLDIAAMLRAIFQEQGWADAELNGVLLHATARRAGARGLALANAYVTLEELNHLSQPGSLYPGDAACGIPSLELPRGIFDQSYVLHWGDELNDQEFAAAVDRTAEYLYLDTSTPIGKALQRCRSGESKSESRSAPLGDSYVRSFGLQQVGGSNSQVPHAMAELLCQQLLQMWRGIAAPAVKENQLNLSDVKALLAAHGAEGPVADSRGTELANEQMAPFQLESLLNQAYEIVQQEVGGDLEKFFVQMVRETQARTLSKLRDNPQQQSTKTLETIDLILGAQNSDEDEGETAAPSLSTMLSGKLVSAATVAADRVRDWTFAYADENPDRIRGAQRFMDASQDLLRQAEKTIAEHVQQFRTHLNELRMALCQGDQEEALAAGRGSGSRSSKTKPQGEAVWLDYVRTRLHIVTLRSVTRQLRIVQGVLTFASDKLRDLWKDLHQMENQFATRPVAVGEDDPLADLLWRQRAELAAEIDGELAATLGSPAQRLRGFLAGGPNMRGSLNAHLRTAARRVALRALKRVNTGEAATSPSAAESDAQQKWNPLLAAARPRLVECGAAQRLLLILPEGSDASEIQQEISEAGAPPATVLLDSDGDIVLCYEAEQLLLSQAAALLVGNNQQALQAASQLHARTDVTWTRFPGSQPG